MNNETGTLERSGLNQSSFSRALNLSSSIDISFSTHVLVKVHEEVVDHDGGPAEEEGEGDAGHQEVGAPAAPVGGLVVAHGSGKRIFLL